MYKHRQRLHRAEWEADRKKPVPPNIMRRSTQVTQEMKMKLAVGATSAFFSKKAEATAQIVPEAAAAAQAEDFIHLQRNVSFN